MHVAAIGGRNGAMRARCVFDRGARVDMRSLVDLSTWGDVRPAAHLSTWSSVLLDIRRVLLPIGRAVVLVHGGARRRLHRPHHWRLFHRGPLSECRALRGVSRAHGRSGADTGRGRRTRAWSARMHHGAVCFPAFPLAAGAVCFAAGTSAGRRFMPGFPLLLGERRDRRDAGEAGDGKRDKGSCDHGDLPACNDHDFKHRRLGQFMIRTRNLRSRSWFAPNQIACRRHPTSGGNA
ncbi:hypothetical protein DWV00_20320 [Trinickia dinghuensis]|uniref:Uncharacterized protein n=1 Tax=Trinickia dinghuensis TaxID=2291023 RepID=A0A3D8JWK8_9BURK|nr:hypothetical protein DWV00_20320 [Trinickia dinghuensis]